MVGTNDHTGARLVSKVPSKEYLENYDMIFNKEPKEVLVTVEKFFPITDKDVLHVELGKAQAFLKECYDKYPDLEYIIAFQEGGVLVTGRAI